jgi:hypothetical protein
MNAIGPQPDTMSTGELHKILNMTLVNLKRRFKRNIGNRRGPEWRNCLWILRIDTETPVVISFHFFEALRTCIRLLSYLARSEYDDPRWWWEQFYYWWLRGRFEKATLLLSGSTKRTRGTFRFFRFIRYRRSW